MTYGSCSLLVDVEDDDDGADDVDEGEEEEDLQIGPADETIAGSVKGETRLVCSSAALARRRTLAMCSCSSRFKWLKSNSTGEAGAAAASGTDAIVEWSFTFSTLSREIGRDK